MTATMNGNGSVGGAEFRMIALSRIRVREGFNPRGKRNPERVAQINASVEHEGLLMPMIVARDGEDYVLVAGEGRHDAAVQARQVEVPVIVREVDERTGGLEIAMAENLAREDFDPVAEARGFGDLRTAGWTVKRIADYFRPLSQKHIKGRLQILELDEQLHPQIADGSIPLKAVPALAKLAHIHRALPLSVAERVGVSKRSWGEPLSWADVERDPIGALIFAAADDDDALPSDVYIVSDSYPVSRFKLTEKAQKDLNAYAKLLNISDPLAQEITFRISDLEQAKGLRAVFANEYDSAHIVVGQDVADQLACDRIAESLKATRQMVRRRREMQQAARDSADAQGPPTTEAPSAEDEAAIEEQERVAAEEEEQRRERERVEQERRRQEVEAHNVRLGHEVFKNLSRLRVDADVLKVLASVPFGQMLDVLAGAGMRYGYPGWPIEPETDSKSSKRTYLTTDEAGERAATWLAQAKAPAEVAGRLVSLLAMARYAQQPPMEPQRSFSWDADKRLPWGEQLLDLIDRICKERLPANLTKEARRELAQHRAAMKRLNGVEERIAKMGADARAKAVDDARLVYGFGTRRFRIEALVRDTPLPASKSKPDAPVDVPAETSTEPTDDAPPDQSDGAVDENEPVAQAA
jgi:ParB/RepB/Spo0J family partition protein